MAAQEGPSFAHPVESALARILDEHGVAWNDPTLAIPWRIDAEPVLSERDANNPNLDWELIPEFS